MLKKCEKIDLSSHNRAWKTLPDMREGKYSFNPCLFNECVYLCGAGSYLMEAFSPQNDNFVPVQIRIPEALSCVMIVHNSLLVVQSENYVSRFAAAQEGQLTLRSEEQCYGDPMRPRSQPVVDSNHGFFYVFSHMVNMVDLENGRVVQRFS